MSISMKARGDYLEILLDRYFRKIKFLCKGKQFQEFSGIYAMYKIIKKPYIIDFSLRIFPCFAFNK